MTSKLFPEFPYEGVSRGTSSMEYPQLQQIPRQRGGKTVVTEGLIEKLRAEGTPVIVIDSLGSEVEPIEDVREAPTILDDADHFELRPYQKEVMDKLREIVKDERSTQTVMFPHRYGGFLFPKSANSGGGQSLLRSKSLVHQTWAAGVVNVDQRPVRTITGLWEAKRPPLYYHVQLAISLWNK